MAVGPSAPPMMAMEPASWALKLGARAQQQGLGVGDQGTEVGHGAHAQEDQGREDADLVQQEEIAEQARRFRAVSFAEDGAAEKVRQQHAEGDGHQQQGLEFLYQGQVQQHAGDDDHNELPPVEQGNARIAQEANQSVKHGLRPPFPSG